MEQTHPCCNERIELEQHCLKRLEPVLAFLSKKWAFHIISFLREFDQSIRFNEIESKFEELDVQVSPNTVTARLREAEKLGLINREIYPEIPPRVEYELTEEGIAFIQAIIPLFEWAEKMFPHSCSKLESLKEQKEEEEED